jgi:hypothetical protein
MELDLESFFNLSNEQQEAIFLYATEKGNNWKEQLASDWMRAAYNWNHPDKSYLLQQVRNQFGPRWLADVCVPDAIKYEILLPERFKDFRLYKLLEYYEVWDATSASKLIRFDGQSEPHNYDSAIAKRCCEAQFAWMEQEITTPEQVTDYYDSYSYARHVEGN